MDGEKALPCTLPTIRCTEAERAAYDAMPDATKFIRRCLTNRYDDDKLAIQQRIAAIEEQMDKLSRERQQLQSHLEDFVDPQNERVKVVVQRFFELGLHKCDTFTQKGWLMGPAQLGDDDVAFDLAWRMIEAKDTEGGWGGD